MRQSNQCWDGEEGCSCSTAENPDHYKNNKIECWDWYEQVLTSTEFQGHMKGLILKYVYRVGSKGNSITDIKKIIAYANRWVEHLEKE